MNFNEALQKLGIEEYAERIFNSNSHGELFHLQDYILLAEHYNAKEFVPWFTDVVKMAEKQWERPESVFQHILKFYNNAVLG